MIDPIAAILMYWNINAYGNSLTTIRFESMQECLIAKQIVEQNKLTNKLFGTTTEVKFVTCAELKTTE